MSSEPANISQPSNDFSKPTNLFSEPADISLNTPGTPSNPNPADTSPETGHITTEAAEARPTSPSEARHHSRPKGRDRRLSLALSRPLTRDEDEFVSLPDNVSLQDLEEKLSRDGYHIVEFEPGKHEDPREWTKGRKWFV